MPEFITRGSEGIKKYSYPSCKVIPSVFDTTKRCSSVSSFSLFSLYVSVFIFTSFSIFSFIFSLSLSLSLAVSVSLFLSLTFFLVRYACLKTAVLLQCVMVKIPAFLTSRFELNII